MQLTRRGWAVGGCGGVLAVGSVLFAAPALLYVAAAVGAVLLGVAAAFVVTLGRTLDTTTVEVRLATDEPLVDARSKLTLRAERSVAQLPMRLSLALPEAADVERVAFELDSHEEASITQPVTWSVAGTYRLGPPRIVSTDPLGLFLAAVEWDADQTVRVQARQPETVHLGEGGRRVAAAFGEHRASQSSTGIEPKKLRRYEPGADISRIDWKATARLDDVFVVEPETETHRQTVLLVDHRATTDVGTGTETALAYVRHAALAIVGSARDLGDPVGLYAIGDRGVTVAEPPDVGPRQYATVEDEIRDLVASRPTGAGSVLGDAGVGSPHRDPTVDPSDRPPAGGASADDPPASGRPGSSAGGAEGATAGSTAARQAAGPASAPSSGAGRDDPASARNGAASARNGTTPAQNGPASAQHGPAPAMRGRESDDSTARSSAAPYDRRTALGGIGRDASFDVRAASRLSDGSDTFARQLLPYFQDPTQYLHRVQRDPLFAAARTYLERMEGSLWTVIVTDDSRRGELRETVKLARSNDDRVLVVLAPRVFFEPGGLADVEEAYERYRDFEEFRRDLASMNRVDALEVAPGDRIEAVLSAGGTNR